MLSRAFLSDGIEVYGDVRCYEGGKVSRTSQDVARTYLSTVAGFMRPGALSCRRGSDMGPTRPVGIARNCDRAYGALSDGGRPHSAARRRICNRARCWEGNKRRHRIRRAYRRGYPRRTIIRRFEPACGLTAETARVRGPNPRRGWELALVFSAASQRSLALKREGDLAEVERGAGDRARAHSLEHSGDSVNV
jgi:hypothetical protein